MNGKFKDIDSIIFDLDGTLWDATEGIATSWSEIISKYDSEIKQITADDLKKYMGLRLEEIAARIFPNMNEDERDKILKECCEYENEYLTKNGAILYEKLEDTLKELSTKYKLFIVSNWQDGYIELFLDYNNFGQYFVDYECPGRTNLSKDENIKLVINRNNLKNPVYVGDTKMDSEAANKAGVPFILARYGFGNAENYYHAIDKFEELLKLDEY